MKTFVAVAFLLFTGLCQAQLAPNAPPDKPVGTDATEAQEIQKKIAPLIEDARRTYPQARNRFERGLPRGHEFFVTTQLRDPQGRIEQVFIHVDSIEGSRISGRIANEIQLISGYQQGDRHVLEESEIMDWLISKPDGSEEGNLIGKFLDNYQR